MCWEGWMTDNEYRSFIETSLENIRKAHNENYLSIFAGAGISAGSGLPKWDKLMEILRKKLYGKIERNEDYRVRAEKFLEQHSIPSQKELANFIKEVEKKLKKELCDEIKRGGDYLVLAEKFFNQFGHNIYYQILRELIPSHAQPNDLHLEIVKLNLKNLITTNWDNLFEKAIYKTGMFFDIIKSDADMGNSMGFSKLIKMHGSLDRENIVFREKDYLEYSQNFSLIENYIKGVFSTDIIVLVGYSLSDPNVKQIISWVTSCSDNVKPIYFIKTNNPFERIEFEFYKNRNIYVLYTHELFHEFLDNKDDKKKSAHEKELEHFFKKIKAKESTKYQTLFLRHREIREIDRALTSFDLDVLGEKIKNLAMFGEISLKNKFLRYFILFEKRTDDENISEIYPLYREISKEAFRNKEFIIWFLSELNKSWGFHPSEHYEQDLNELEEKFLKLPLSEREKLKPFTQLPSCLDQQLIAIYRSLIQVVTDRSYRKHGVVSTDAAYNSHTALQRLKKLDWIRIGNCLTIPRYEEHRKIYTSALECFWCEISISVLCAKNAGREIPTLSVDAKILSYSVRYFQTIELKEIFQKYFTGLTLRIKVDGEFLGEIFTNICSRFEKRGTFETRSSRWFNNFLFLTSYCALTQSTFEKIIKEANRKIEERVASSSQYDRIGHFVEQQSQNNTLDLQKCLDLVLSYLNLFVENRAGWYEMQAQQIFLKIAEKIKITGEEYKNLITEFIDKIHQYRQTFLPLINALYQSSDADLKKAIKDKLQYILDHKEDYAQTKASEKYCQWLKEFIEGLSR